MNKNIPWEIIYPEKEHTGTVIWLHGRGDQGDNWAETLLEIQDEHIKYICPTAKERPITSQGGVRMNAWFDSYGLTERIREDTEGIKEAIADVHRVINEQIAGGVPASQIALGGFSQGAALSLMAGIRYPQKLGGIIGLSGYLFHRESMHEGIVNRDTPILMCHGTSDTVVPFSFGKYSYEFLVGQGFTNVTFSKYPGMEHTVTEHVMLEVKEFLEQQLG